MSGRKVSRLIDFPLPGAVRIPKEVYRTIQEWAGESVKQEIDRIREKTTMAVESFTQRRRTSGAHKIPESDVPLGMDLGRLIEEESLTDDERKKFGKLKGEKARKKLREVLVRRAKVKTPARQKSEKTTSKADDELHKLLKKVYGTSNKNFIENKLRKLNLKSNRDKVRILLDLYELKIKFENIPFLFRLKNKPEEFKKIYGKALKKIESIGNTKILEDTLNDIAKFVEETAVEAVEGDRKVRFEEAKKKAREALNEKGYTSFSEKDCGNYVDIEGTKNGKKAHVRILKPDGNDSLPPVEIEIEEKGYSNEEEWEREGRELAKELSSLGVEFEEVSTHFKGKLLKSAANVIKRALERKGKKGIEVSVEEDNVIQVRLPDGTIRDVTFTQDMSIKDLISSIKKSEAEEPTYREREKIMEVE